MITAGKLAALLTAMLRSGEPEAEAAVRGMAGLVREMFGKFVTEGLNKEPQKLMMMLAAGERPRRKGEILVYEALQDLYKLLEELFGLLGFEIILWLV